MTLCTGFLQPRKISLNCRVKRVRGVRGKRDRRLYFLQKVPDSDQFRLMYPPTVRGNRNVSRRAAREKIADAICDVRTSCTEPSICTKPCQEATRPAIKYFGRTPFDRRASEEVRYVLRDERFFLLCNLQKAKIDPTGIRVDYITDLFRLKYTTRKFSDCGIFYFSKKFS